MKHFTQACLFALSLVVMISGTATSATCDSSKTSWHNPCRSGGGGGFAPSFVWLDLKPLEAVIKNEADLGRYDFNFKDNMFMTFGGTGYGGNSCGMKFGGTGSFGFKKFISSEITVPVRDSMGTPLMLLSDTVTTDSVAHLLTMIAWGGFTIDKGFAAGNCMFGIGGMLGGGAIILNKSFKENKKGSSAFSNVYVDTSMEDISTWSAAPLTCLDVHANFSYRVIPGIVIGTEAFVLFMHSSTGFNMNTDSFITSNPGVTLKIIFGNI